MDFTLDSHGDLPGPLNGDPVWDAATLIERPEWNHRLDESEQAELRALASRLDAREGEPSIAGKPMSELTADELPLPSLAPRLEEIGRQLEHGAGAVRLRGFPIEGLGETEARLLYWAMAIRVGTLVSQSARGERIFSVRDAGFGNDDPRSRGPNTSKRLTFHTDRADVVGFLCLQPAKEGGENEIASSMTVYNAILARRPDLLTALMEPFYYLRHTVDSGNARPWCRLPVFSFREGHFACCLLRVLIERAHAHADLPDLTPRQIEALDLVESLAADVRHNVRFMQKSGDLIWLNNWVILHKRQAFVDWPELERRRHILRLWLSMPESRPLDPLFADHFGTAEAGALRGGMRARS